MTVEQAERQVARKIDLTKLTRSQARIEIARDVLAWMDLKKFKVTRGSYFLGMLPDELGSPEEALDLRDTLPQLERCEVCAIGACFVAVVARVNDFKVEADCNEITIDDSEMFAKLKPYFTQQELSRLESMFELNVIDYRDEDEGTCMEFVAWGSRIGREDSVRSQSGADLAETRNNRMRALMMRIITTDGAEPITVPDYPGRAKDLGHIKAWSDAMAKGIEFSLDFPGPGDEEEEDEPDDEDEIDLSNED